LNPLANAAFYASGLIIYYCLWRKLINNFDDRSLIRIPNLVELLGECGFAGCGINEVSFAPDSVLKRIDQGPFESHVWSGLLFLAQLKFSAIRVSPVASR
jgi:hypothetical protein